LAGARFAGIPEPETILYGQVVTLVGDREYLVNQGELTWTISGSIDGLGPYQFVTQLESLANGQFCYHLKIPHEVLAYDLEVASDVVPLTAGPWSFEHLDIRVNGHPADILPPAEPSFVARQSARARTHRIDLIVQMPTRDSDGDGLPDWWEDENGYDKWDPADGALTTPGLGTNAGRQGGAQFMTFSRWREGHFPGAAGSLEEFAELDPDEDSLPNLAEYAFDTNPKIDDRSAALVGRPRADVRDGHLVLTFRHRRDAADLEFVAEISDDLQTWAPASDSFEEISPPEQTEHPEIVCLRNRTAITDLPQRYVRLRIRLRD
jgi:hypothetical protein